MTKRFVFLLMILFCAGKMVATDPKYPVSSIPEELKKDVNAVVREDKMVYTIISKNRGSQYAKYVVTILNGNAKRYAKRSFFYDKLSKLRDLKAAAYDAQGNL